MRTLRIYFQQLSHITYSSVSYIYPGVHYIISIYKWKFIYFDIFIQFPLPLPCASGNHKSDLFFPEFVFEVYLTYSTMIGPGAQLSDLLSLYISKWCLQSAWLPSVTTKIWRYYWVYSPLYLSYLWLTYFVTGHLYLLISLTCFSPPPVPSSLAITWLSSVSMTLFFFFLCLFFRFQI